MATAESDKTTRRLPNWLDSWLSYTAILPSPQIFRKWAGIGILSAVMEQRVWVRTRGSNLYPNTYIILTGPPGVGKSAILSQSERLMKAVPELHVAPSNVTTASLIDMVAASVVKRAFPDVMIFNSVQVIASELGVFLPAYDPAFMNTLQKLYDKEPYEERRRTSTVKHVKIESPNLSILGGTTPSYLNSFLPEGAWDQGFTSRTLFVYSGETSRPPLFPENEDEYKAMEHIYIDLLHDIKAVHEMCGRMSWTREAMEAISAWDNAGCPPVPEHGKLTHYNTRRLAHAIKLTMVACAVRTQDMLITVDDFQKALDWLLEVEALMPDIFKSMGISGDARAMEDAWYFIYQIYVKEKKPVAEYRVVSFLKDRVPSHSIQKIIEIMVRSKTIKVEIANGLQVFIPERKI